MASIRKAREVVFFGTDRGSADVAFRQQTYKLDQQFGRSITLENAMKPEPMLAYAMNGDPLTLNQGFPVRLHDARLVRRGQREVALGGASAGGSLPRQLSGALVPFGGRRGRHRRGYRSANAVGGDRNHSHAPEVGDRARAKDRRQRFRFSASCSTTERR